jgi:hypothetical protein
MWWMDGRVVPPSNLPPDQALLAELAASTRDSERSARPVGDLRGHPRTGEDG